MRALKSSSEELGGTSRRGVEGVGSVAYSPSLMGLEVHKERSRVSGLLQTCLFSLYMSVVVRRKDKVLGGVGGWVQKLGTRLFGVEAIFTSYSSAGRIFF